MSFFRYARYVSIVALVFVAATFVYLDYVGPYKPPTVPLTPIEPIRDDTIVNLLGYGSAFVPNCDVGTSVNYELAFRVKTTSKNCCVLKTGLASNGINVFINPDGTMAFSQFDFNRSFIISVGTGQLVVSDGNWHECVVGRKDGVWYVNVDSSFSNSVKSDYPHAIESPSNLIIGYYFDEGVPSDRRFVGCIRQLTVNGLIVDKFVTTGTVTRGQCLF